MNDSKNRKRWLLAGGLLAIGAVYVMFLFVPNRRALAQFREDVDAKQTHLMSATSLGANLAAAEDELDAARRYVETWRQRVPKTKAMSSVFARVHALARQAGVKTVRFEPQPPQEIEGLIRVAVQFGCSGQYGQLHEFLRQIEGLNMPLWVDSVQIRKTAETADAASADIVLVVFADNRSISD